MVIFAKSCGGHKIVPLCVVYDRIVGHERCSGEAEPNRKRARSSHRPYYNKMDTHSLILLVRIAELLQDLKIS